jgi:hypothetical protein
MEFKQDLICYSWSGWIRSLSEPTAWSFPLRLFPCRRGPDMPPPILISAARTYGHVAGLPCPALRWIYDLTRPRACMHASSDDQRYRAVAALAITRVAGDRASSINAGRRAYRQAQRSRRGVESARPACRRRPRVACRRLRRVSMPSSSPVRLAGTAVHAGTACMYGCIACQLCCTLH